ncbi:MAG: NADH-quinone oxidoreductase subunit A [Dehalococcoidia bacterium]|nr:NADH-quinone oxidoreductase subunit A [Dehalococcoidia bacterium]
MPEGYAVNYGAVVLAAIVGLGAVGALFVGNFVLSSRRPSAMKELPFECGAPAAPFSWSQMNIRYYIFAILFLVFDVEAVFLFPWVLIFVKSTPAVFYEMLIFVGILMFGILYGWRKGMLEWK